MHPKAADTKAARNPTLGCISSQHGMEQTGQEQQVDRSNLCLANDWAGVGRETETLGSWQQVKLPRTTRTSEYHVYWTRCDARYFDTKLSKCP